MSKAGEWAATQTIPRPVWGSRAGRLPGSAKLDTPVAVVQINDAGRPMLQLHETHLTARAALALARWIVDTFDETPEVPDA